MAKRGYESQKTGQKVDDLLDKIDNLNVPEWALQESKPSYTAQEVHALPENTSIPKKTSDLVNDRGFITQESDPTVPSWAKQPSKPGYTAQEVGALPSDTPLFSGDYNDLRNKPTIPTVPENVSAFNNDAGYLTDEDMGDYATKQELQGKQDTINDLASIRSGANAGATAYQKPESGIPENDLSQGVKDKMNEKDVFWATYGTTTAAEIDAAVAAGKLPIVVYDGKLYVYSNNTTTNVLFTNTYLGQLRRVQIDKATGTWGNSYIQAEQQSNRRTSWQATPDNTHYPSEKLVKDSLDAKADIGDILFANFSRLTPKKTFEYDVSDTAYHPLFSRANTGISQLMSEVDDIVKFRITVTGTNIYARVDVVVRFQPALTYPCIMAWNDLRNTSYTGLFNIRGVFPKALDNGYNFIVEFNCYNNTARHIKVEVYEDTENITWTESNTASSYNSTYQSNSGVQIYSNRGLCINQNGRFENAFCYSAYFANYISHYLPTWLRGTLPLTGEALTTGSLAVVSEQKIYKATNKNVPIDCDNGVFLNDENISANGTNNFVNLRQKSTWTTLTGDPTLTMDTFARGDQVYLRCTLGQDGKIYPDGHLSNVKSAGYTWVHIGTAASATAINLDTCGKPFITLNNDGKVTHVNGIQVMDSSMSKWGVVSQTQTWTQASDGGYDYTMSNLQYGYIPQSFIDDVTSFSGVEFNETTGYFEINTLVDVTYQDMLKIRHDWPICLMFMGGIAGGGSSILSRTLIPISNTSTALLSYGFFNRQLTLEVINFKRKENINSQTTNNIAYMCRNDYSLKKILGINVTATTAANVERAFEKCYSLEIAEIDGLRISVSFSDSSRLTAASVAYMINHSYSSAGNFTITLHATAYARAIADTDVQAALQAHTNVSLASA